MIHLIDKFTKIKINLRNQMQTFNKNQIIMTIKRILNMEIKQNQIMELIIWKKCQMPTNVR